jgi:cytochrome c-type biogenesis protein
VNPLASFAALAGAAFFAGVASIASPCVLPLVPAYLAAATATHVTHADEGPASRSRRVAGAVLFVCGFSAIFVSLGAFAGAVASIVPTPSQARLAGLVLCAVGMSSLGLRLLPAVGIVRLLSHSSGQRSSPFLLGAVFALAATPCTTTLLGLSLTSAVAGATATRGALILACYGAGLAAGFFAVGLAVGGAASCFRRLRSYYDGVARLAAGITVLFGIALALGQGWRLNVVAAHVLDHL